MLRRIAKPEELTERETKVQRFLKICQSARSLLCTECQTNEVLSYRVEFVQWVERHIARDT